jgi:hypothetical protein
MSVEESLAVKSIVCNFASTMHSPSILAALVHPS